ncbi:MAG: alpha/beta hydrolase [Cyanobacteriota bacterium]|nr:alpha/beta hydrolase [Cyanobacteriota bacterium]
MTIPPWPPRPQPPRPWFGPAAGLALLAAGLAWPGSAAAQPRAPASPSTLSWGPCPAPAPSRSALECATLSVPLDHSRPGEDPLPLTVWRLRAPGPEPRLGTLVLLDGAPGAPEALSLEAMAQALPPALTSRWDLVSWQRRGTGRRGRPAALHCFPSEGEARAWRERLPPSPSSTPEGQRRWLEAWATLARACERHQGRLMPHLSSADSARDLELLRQALGERTLRLRASGGATLVAATYANLFPRSLGALVLDGAADPHAWTDNGNPRATEGSGYRLERDLGAGATLIAFLRRCAAAGRPRCAFAASGAGGGQAATERRWAELLARLRQGPLRWGNRRLGTGEVLDEVVRRLRTVSPDREGRGGWEGAGRVLEALAGGDGGREAPAEAPADGTAPEQTLATLCGDGPQPRQLEAIQALAAQARNRSGPLGPWVVWGDGRCAAWPVAAAPYGGPWNTPTPAPVLVIGHRFDPILPFQSSLAMARELDQATLLSVNGYGHTVLRNASACAGRYETALFMAGLLPPPGTVCGSDAPPFALAP